MAIDESILIRDPAAPLRVTLSRWVNESPPSCQEILTAHDVARLTRRPRWVLETLTLFGRFPHKRRFHGRRIGWCRRDVLLWLGAEAFPDHNPSDGGVADPHPLQRELQLRLPPCRSSRAHRSRCTSSRPGSCKRSGLSQGQKSRQRTDSNSTFPDRRRSASERTSETP